MVVCCIIFAFASVKGQRPLQISIASKPGTEKATNRMSDRERLRSSTFVAECIERFMAITRKTMIFPEMKKNE
jgi:hypothetical protein